MVIVTIKPIQKLPVAAQTIPPIIKGSIDIKILKANTIKIIPIIYINNITPPQILFFTTILKIISQQLNFYNFTLLICYN
jgi:hypothetical protein